TLKLRRTDSLAGDVERVVAAPVQEPVAVVVDGCPVAVCPHPRKAAPVRIEIALVVAPDSTRHSGPRPPADELADFAAHRLSVGPEHIHVLSERGKPQCNGLDRLRDACGEEARTDLRSAGD